MVTLVTCGTVATSGHSCHMRPHMLQFSNYYQLPEVSLVQPEMGVIGTRAENLRL